MADSNALDPLAGAGGALGSVLGYFLDEGDRDQARQDYQRAIDAYGNTHAVNQSASDPRVRGAELDALNQLEQTYKSQGMDPQMKAQLAQIQASNAQQAQAANARVQNEMAQRGLSSSGSNFAAQRANDQAASNNNYMQSLQAQALANQRQMQALQGAGELAGNIRGADDAINRFNAQNQTGFNEWQAGGQAGAYGNQANFDVGQANQVQRMGAGIGSAAGAAAGFALNPAGGLMSSFAGKGGSGGSEYDSDYPVAM